MLSESIIDKRLISASWWIVVFIAVEFFDYTFVNNAVLNVLNILLCDAIAFCVYYKYCNTSYERRQGSMLLSFIFVLWLFSIFAGMAHGGDSILRPYVLMMMLSNAFIAYTIIKKTLSVYPFKIAFYAISAYFLYLIIIKEVGVFEMFPRSGSGRAGSVVLSLSIIIQYIELRNYGRINLLTVLLAFVVCIMAYSRSSLVCGAVYFLVTLFFATRRFKNFFVRNIIFIVVFALIAYQIINNWDAITTLDIYEKFNRKGLDNDGRQDIWSAYLGNMNFPNIILGIPIDTAHPLKGFTNPHNSLIQLHSQIGMFAFVFFYYILKGGVRLMMKNIYLALLLIILIVRGSTDIVFFFNYFDFVIYVLIFEQELKRRQVTDISLSIF